MNSDAFLQKQMQSLKNENETYPTLLFMLAYKDLSIKAGDGQDCYLSQLHFKLGYQENGLMNEDAVLQKQMQSIKNENETYTSFLFMITYKDLTIK